MTVTVAPRYKRFLGNDTTGPFSFTFPILLSNTGTPYIDVKLIDADGVETTLAYPADYSISPLLLGKGGAIITTTNSVATGEELFIEANTPLDQQISFRNQGEFSAESHENGFDKIHFILIEGVQKGDLSIRFPSSEIGISTTLPVASLRSNTSLGFDASGGLLCGSVANIMVSSVMTPFVQSSSKSDARDDLSVYSKADVYTKSESYSKAEVDAAWNGLVAYLGRNRIINGGMAVDQRNEGAVKTYTAGAALSYGVDMWYGYCTGANVTGQRTASGGGYVYRFTGASSVTSIGFGNRIEADDCFDLAGGLATLSVDLANSLLTTVTWTAYYANTKNTFGSLASPTKTQIATGTFTVSSTKTRYSAVIGVPAGATTGIEIVFSVGAQTSGTFDVGDVQLEKGSVATPFERRPIGLEFKLAEAYCEKIGFGTDIAPFQGTARICGSGLVRTTTSATLAPINFRTKKFATPTMTPYRGSGAGGDGLWEWDQSSSFVASINTFVGANSDREFNATLTISGGTVGRAFLARGGALAECPIP